MTDRITVELDRELAERFIKRTANYDGPFALVRDRFKAALPPEWEEGTVAWVTGKGAGHTYIAVWDGEKWCERIGGTIIALASQTAKVKPIRVLKDDEVAVKRIGGSYSARTWRWAAENDRKKGDNNRAALAEAYADALEAER